MGNSPSKPDSLTAGSVPNIAGASTAKIIAKALFYASIQASIGSVEMSSKFSVLSFSKDQVTLQRAADALKGYLKVASIWTTASTLALYASHGMLGAWMALGMNVIMMLWIAQSYIDAFNIAAKEHGLEKPKLFSGREFKTIIIFFAAVVGILTYLTIRGTAV